MKATGLSTWVGSWKGGKGSLSTETQFFKNEPYSYASRFEGAVGGSPEELLAVAHAGCFNQALANNFGKIDLEAESIETAVAIDFGTGDDGSPVIKSSHITVSAKAPGASEEQFLYCANRARTNCTISKIMKCEITMDAKLLP
ncbi:OsmC family peroxiredoxin [Paraburkholderia sp. BL25I1N1]|uniref:OsmC family peroxiredoxin n=1 Tax=Paraburkholderia sp. BL25I1N1 TaxID=1938804 RepID=UPI000D055712|nr:OsmC family peroxiredoxin [Paraburkholderia sp. BL25I1N1]PRY04441.1 osmotically inducible protein OsmC [Paraburkholderia sp. BL25I1N1]